MACGGRYPRKGCSFKSVKGFHCWNTGCIKSLCRTKMMENWIKREKKKSLSSERKVCTKNKVRIKIISVKRQLEMECNITIINEET